jgi:hypothetical protein
VATVQVPGNIEGAPASVTFDPDVSILGSITTR